MEKKNQVVVSQKSQTTNKIIKSQSCGNYIYNLSDEDIRILIRKILQLVGANDKNVPGDKEFINKNFKDVFGKWTAEEVLLAFMLGLEGKLENIDMKLYDKPFNLVYVSEIMKAYKNQIKSPVMISHNKRLLDTNHTEKKPSEEEKRELCIKNIVTLYQRFLEKKTITDYGGAAHSKLFKCGLINWDTEETTQIIEQMYEVYEARNEKKAEFADNIVRRAVLENISNMRDPNKIEKQGQMIIYRELSLTKFFSTLDDSDVSVDVFKEMLEERI